MQTKLNFAHRNIGERETKVVCLKRSKGQVVQGCDVYIGRRMTMGGWNLPESIWANPFTISHAGSVERAVELYRAYILERPDLLSQLGDLKGKVLGCWCKKKPTDLCHGDVLVECIKKYNI